jgi:hypothetical protein
MTIGTQALQFAHHEGIPITLMCDDVIDLRGWNAPTQLTTMPAHWLRSSADTRADCASSEVDTSLATLADWAREDFAAVETYAQRISSLEPIERPLLRFREEFARPGIEESERYRPVYQILSAHQTQRGGNDNALVLS